MAEQRPLTPQDLYALALREDPLLALKMQPSQAQPMTDSQSIGRGMGEAAAVADPFGAISIQRMLGANIDPRILMNETHGLANKQQDQMYRAIAERLRGR